MKQFFKFMFASALGFILGGFLLFLVLIGIAAGMAATFSGEEKEVSISDNSVLRIHMNYPIPERSKKGNFDFSAFGQPNAPKVVGLNDILLNIKKAGDDAHIKGIMLDLDMTGNSYAALEEIRTELKAFKKKGKFIVAYAEMLDEHGYYLASLADHVYMNPSGELLLNGFSSQVMYLKNALDKLGVKPELIRHGKYKSAGEPLIADHMSDANRKQIESYLGSLYGHFVSEVANDRHKSVQEVTEMINELKIQHPEDAMRLGMIDSLKYEDEVEAAMKNFLHLGTKDKVNYVDLHKYKNVKGTVSVSDNKIAVVYCTGDIVSGNSSEESMGSATIAATIKKIREDDGYKALVLRINSPGGSALASDVIWREIVLTKKVKPVVVSMGAVAASGGYFIAAPADVIVAEPNTITGSIGVFGLLMNAKELLNDKLGINIETVKFGEYADLGSPDRALTANERAIIQKAIDRIYSDFVKRVADGRHLKTWQVDSIAQGRVWTGEEARKIGLVDEFGGLDKAIEIAVKKAKLSAYRTVSLPEQKDPFEEIFQAFGDEASVWMLKRELGTNYHWFKDVRKAMKYQGIQARMEYEIDVQ